MYLNNVFVSDDFDLTRKYLRLAEGEPIFCYSPAEFRAIFWEGGMMEL